MIKDWFRFLFSAEKRTARRRVLLSGRFDNREIKPHWQEQYRDEEGALKVERCYNCGVEFTGKYCPNCGQHSGGRKLTMALLLDRVLAVLTNLDRGFWRTFIDLFWRPGYLMRDIMRGQHKRYGNPFALLFIAITFFLLEIHIFNPQISSTSIFNISNKENEEVVNPDNLSNDDEKMRIVFTKILNLKQAVQNHRLANAIIEKIENNREFSILIMIPMYAIALKWVMTKSRIRALERRRRRRIDEKSLYEPAIIERVVARRYCNFTESCTLFLYYALQLMLISIVTVPFMSKINLSSFSDSGFLLSLILLSLIIGQLYHLRFWRAIWKSLLLMLVLSAIKFAIFISLFLIGTIIILLVI
ncbi:MAG: DUF3667 domain-containing protein [bacterium]|nr:DUF3667 domain-containing protein [bacterium]